MFIVIESESYIPLNFPFYLQVCSKSVVFVPFSQVLPMLKFPLSECDSIEEWTPKSFQSALACKQEVRTSSFLFHDMCENFLKGL